MKLCLTVLREAELVDGRALDEEADGDAGAVLRVVGGVVGAVGGVADVAGGVDLGSDIVGDALVFDLFEGDDVGSVEDVADGEGDLLEPAGIGGLGYVDGLGGEGLSGGDDGRAGASVVAVDAGRDVVEIVGGAGVVEALDVEGGHGELIGRGGRHGLDGDAGGDVCGVICGVDEETGGDVVVVVAIGEVETPVTLGRMAPVETLMGVSPVRKPESTKMRSGLSSNLAMPVGAPGIGVSRISMPGSRKGCGVPVMTA